MPDDELTEVQRNVLLTLMIKAEPISYKSVSGSLTRDKRLDLEKRGYIIETRESNGAISMELTQRGHDRAVQELPGPEPAGKGTRELVFFASLDFLSRLLDHCRVDPQDLFRLRIGTPQPAPAQLAGDTPSRIRAAYAAAVTKRGDKVMLADLRDALPDVARADVDAALVAMNLEPEVHLFPESNQKVLTARERDGAVNIGNQDKHLISIGT